MALIDVERTVLALCFRAQVPDALLDELGGDRRSWLLYRHMVRERLLRELRIALPRSRQLLGDANFEAEFEAYLEREPPRTRYFREVVAAFTNATLPRLQSSGQLHPAALDMLRYESAVWEVGDLDARETIACSEFAFDRVPVVSRALRLISVAHAVHLAAPEAVDYTPGEFWLGVHRKSDAEPTQTWAFNAVTYVLLERWQHQTASVTESVQQLARERAWQVNAKFVDGLCGSLAQLIEAGIVLGSR